ncbi:MAG: MCE family protein [Betaproteobacteria bacterium]|jgi:phospholipid/cholesterol/gamma-HCH transport system substrate-binding protein|nr:MCE family protein [Betaproteobacteria bacterium]
MENKSHALAAGSFVLALVVLMLSLVFWLTKDANKGRVYEISTTETVSGLQNQAPVRFKGVLIGKVTRMGFDPQSTGHVLIRIEVDPHAPVTQTTYATLNSQGITGLSFVQLDDESASSAALETSRSEPARLPLRQGLLDNLGDRGTVILTKVDQGLNNMNKLLGDDNQIRIATALEKLALAANSTSQLARQLESTASRRLDPALEGVPGTVARFDKTMASIDNSAKALEQTAAEFRQLAKRLTDKNGAMDQLNDSTIALTNAVTAISTVTLPRLNRVGDEAAHAARQIGRTADALRENPQSLVFGHGRVQPGPGEEGFTTPVPPQR